jgi:hypothetical protein
MLLAFTEAMTVFTEIPRMNIDWREISSLSPPSRNGAV